MSYWREQVEAHIQDNILPRVINSFVTQDPIMAFMGAGQTYSAKNPYAKTGAGRATPEKFLGMPGMTKAQKKTQLGKMDAQPRFVTSEPDDAAFIGYGGTLPTATSLAEDRFGTCRFRWSDCYAPIEIRQHTLMGAKGKNAIANVLDDSTAPIIESFMKFLCANMWNGTLNQSQQNETVWSGGLLGIIHQVNENNIFGTVDRTSQPELNANVLPAATAFGTTTVTLDMIRKVQHGFTKTSGGDFEGIAPRTTNGAGAGIVIVHPHLYQSLAAESEGYGVIHYSGIPGRGMAGFRNPIIEYGNTYITYSRNCPTGSMYLLDLDMWSLEVQKGCDFVFSGLTDETKVKAGGRTILFGSYRYTPRLMCHAPHLQTVITGLTAA